MTAAHPIDRLAPLAYRFNRRSTIFGEGWGDEAAFELFGFPITAADPLPELDLAWGRKEEHQGFRVRRAQFTSPAASVLPETARVVTVEWIEPAVGSDRAVVLLPAWNDEGFEVRRRLAELLAAVGVGSVIPDLPLYGRRRRQPDDRPAITTVSDFALLGYGAVSEARGLVRSVAELAHPGVAGFSMGASLAACVSATVARPVATAPIAGAPGPAEVFLDGLMSSAVDWKALGGREEAEPRLRALLDAASVLTMPQLAHHPAAVVLSGSRDGIVRSEWSRRLAAHWDAELRTVEGAGHGTLLWRHRPVMAEAIVDAFARIDA